MSSHFTGKTYDLTQENFKKVISELEAANLQVQALSKMSMNRAEDLEELRCRLLKERQISSDNYQDMMAFKEGEFEALRAKHEELFSYLPKVPTEPYEKQIARELIELRADAEKLRAALEDTVDSGYDQAGHCFSALAEWDAKYKNEGAG